MLVFSTRRSDRTGSQSGAEEVLYRSDGGVPMLWVFAFGGRNIWDPGDDVRARGGAVGERDLYETPVEVALARLQHAEGNLHSAPALRFWFSAMSLLRRTLLLKPNRGFVRIAAPWVASADEDTAVHWRRATSFAENVVNYAGAGDLTMAMRNLQELEAICPFLPCGKLGDLGQLSKASRRVTESDPAKCLALLTVGQPTHHVTFERGVERDVVPALEDHQSLEEEAFEIGELPSSQPGAGAAVDGGLVGRLAGLFRREKPSSAPRS